MRNDDKRLLLLGLLRIQKMHGYQLQQFLDQHMEFVTSLKAPTAYYTLEKMAKEGLVEAKSEQAGNRPVRQVYCLTVKGEELFRCLLDRNLSSYELGETADDIGTAFLSMVSPEEADKLLANKRKQAAKRLAEVNEALNAVKRVEPSHLSLVRARLRLEADLNWIDNVSSIIAMPKRGQ